MLRTIVRKRLVVNVAAYSTDASENTGRQKRRDQLRNAASKIKYADPDISSYIFFPGQGAQYVGMAKELIQYPEAKRIFHLANKILGYVDSFTWVRHVPNNGISNCRYDLLKLCLEGPEEKLNETIYCQPAVFVSSLAAIERLKVLHPEAIQNCIATAGFSLGELTALTFAGALPFDRGKNQEHKILFQLE